jgi:manganese transport protein
MERRDEQNNDLRDRTDAQIDAETTTKFFPNFFEKYGLAFVMVASYFGSGSIFIASSAGVRFGYALIWAVVGAVLLGFMAQDMSARLGMFGEPLMVFTRKKLGKPLALLIALWLTVGSIAWTLELTAAVGAGISALLAGFGVEVAWQPLAIFVGIGAIIIGLLGYGVVERVMTFMMFALMVLYVIVALASSPDFGELALGFIPTPDTFTEFGALVLVAGILGTTALWPNFFLESILVDEKDWHSDEDIPNMRRDLAVGYGMGGVITVAILVVAAAILRPLGITELDSFITPGLALSGVLGDWAMAAFVIGAIGAAFNSIIPIMWAPAYLIPQALGQHVNTTTWNFKMIYVVGVAIGTLSPVVHELTGLTVVEMIILFPTFNGIFCLPLSAALLYWAINDRKTMGTHKNTLTVNVINALLVVMSVVLATLSARGFINAVTGGL